MAQDWTEQPLSGFEALAPEPSAPIGERVHPFAALFPMMADDDLADLAADIQANGLIHPLIVDSDGQLIDGRNRQAACERAGVAPRYETLPAGTDAAAFILGANVHRRHLTQGAKAMAVAMAGVFSTNSLRAAARSAQVSASHLSYAQTVRQWAEELIPQVMAGASLNEAYAIAQQRKQDAEADARYLEWLTAHHASLAVQVNTGELTLAEARAAAKAIAQTEAAEAEAARLREAITLAREEIGDPSPLPPRREMPTQFTDGAEPEFARQTSAQGDALRREHEFLQRLIRVKQELAGIAAEPVLRDVSWSEGHLNAVRSAAVQMVTAIYQLVDVHEAALGDGPALRKVK